MIFLVVAAVVVAVLTAYVIWAGGKEHRIESAFPVQARANEVWAVLVDFPSYPEWNPFLTSVSGLLAEDERLEAAVTLPGGAVHRFRARVLRVSPARQIRWLGRLGPAGLLGRALDGILDVEHYLVLEPQPDGSTVVTHGERFTGVLVPLRRVLIADHEHGLASMDEALIARVASRS